jgi:hypothetical protein
MPTFLSDPQTWNYIALFLAALLAIKAPALFGEKPGRIVLAGMWLLLLFVIVCDLCFVSPREASIRQLRVMETAANARDWPQVFERFSDQFRYEPKNKKGFEVWVVPIATQHNATVHFKGFDRDQVTELPDGSIRVGCIVQISAPSVSILPYYFEATFREEPDGIHRMTTFAVYDYVKRREGGEQKIPGW